MNEPHEPLSDDVIDELMTCFRDVALPGETRATNRAAVEKALARRVQLPWWRKTVAVPLPVATAAALALAVTVTVLLWQTRTQQRVMASESQRLVTRESSNGLGEEPKSRSSWSVTRSYIQTLGAFGSMRNDFDFKTKERQNES